MKDVTGTTRHIITGGQEFMDEPAFLHENVGVLEAPLYGGMARMRTEIHADVCTGPPGSDSSPGVSIRMEVEGRAGDYLKTNRGTFIVGGVLGRDGARALHTLLTNFLKDK